MLLLVLLSYSAHESSWVYVILLSFSLTGIIEPLAEFGMLSSLILWTQEPVYSETSWITSKQFIFGYIYSVPKKEEFAFY